MPAFKVTVQKRMVLSTVIEVDVASPDAAKRKARKVVSEYKNAPGFWTDVDDETDPRITKVESA